MEQSKKIRNSNLEFLRIISMVFIILHHIAVHGIGLANSLDNINSYIVNLFSVGGKIGVSIFVLIGGYFMYKSQASFKKILKLYGEVFFYSVVIGTAFYFVPTLGGNIGAKEYIKSFFPIIMDEYWFFSCYFLIMLFCPLLNKIVDSVKKQNLQCFLMIFAFIWGVIPLLYMREIEYNLYNIFMVIYLYILSSYISKYVDIDEINGTKHIFLGLVEFIVLFIASQALVNLGYARNIEALKYSIYKMIEINSIFILLPSVEIFIGFLTIKPRYSKFVNLISGSVFSVYLIHDNSFVRNYLWKALNIKGAFVGDKFAIYAIIVALVIFAFCIIVDLIRRFTIDKLYLLILDKYYDVFIRKSSVLLNRVRKIVFKCSD